MYTKFKETDMNIEDISTENKVSNLKKTTAYFFFFY